MSGRNIPGSVGEPLKRIPSDLVQGLRARLLRVYDDIVARSKADGHDLTNNELLIQILANTDIDILLRTLSKAFLPRVINVVATPTLLISPNRYPRGYIILNPATTITGVTTNVTIFTSASRAAGVHLSPDINVAGHGAVGVFLDVTVPAGGSLVIDHLSRDPETSTDTVVAADIFAGFNAVGTRYRLLGPIGVDNILRLRATVVGTAATFSIGGVLKPSLGTTIPGATVFLGDQDVNTVTGYPLLGAQKETWYLRENTPLFGIVTVGIVELRLFELQ